MKNCISKLVLKPDDLRSQWVKIHFSEHDLQKTKKIKDTRRTIQGAIALLVILGVSNIFMVFMVSDTQTKEIVAYFFIIFNALQGPGSTEKIFANCNFSRTLKKASGYLFSMQF